MSKARGIFNFCAFVATCCIGISLLIGQLGLGSVSSIFAQIAEIIAYTLTAITAFFYVNYKRHWAFYLVWAICVILIVVLLIIR